MDPAHRGRSHRDRGRKVVLPVVNPLNKHPNATVALISSFGLGSLVVTACQHWFGWTLSTQDGLYVAGGLATAALFIGRNGAIGTWNAVKNVFLHGTGGKHNPKP